MLRRIARLKSIQLHSVTGLVACGLSLVLGLATLTFSTEAAAKGGGFHLEEATIADIQSAILHKQITTTELLELYLKRIKAYNGTCVKQPYGLLGSIETIANAGQLNALSTLNLRPAARKYWGFDDRKARSMTDKVDNDPKM